MIRFKATKEQVQEIAVKAIEASSPVGLGFAHFNPKQKFHADQIKISEGSNAGIFLDYVGGRMVKLQIWKKGEDEWETHDKDADPEYQSWCREYPTYKDLVRSVGIPI